MTIQDVFSSGTKQVDVTGKIETGSIKKDWEIEIIGKDNISKKATVIDIRREEKNSLAFNRFFNSVSGAIEGDNVTLTLKGVFKKDVEIGDIIKRC